MDGMGMYTWPDGRRYAGEYKDNKKHGYGVYIQADSSIYLGQWRHGKQHGLGIYKTLYQVGELPTITFKHGIWEDGKHLEWFDESTL